MIWQAKIPLSYKDNGISLSSCFLQIVILFERKKVNFDKNFRTVLNNRIGYFAVTDSFLPAQYGQFVCSFPVLLETEVIHSCPLEHSHQTFLLHPAVTWSGVRESFLSKFHCAAISGCRLFRSFFPGMTFCPEQ